MPSTSRCCRSRSSSCQPGATPRRQRSDQQIAHRIAYSVRFSRRRIARPGSGAASAARSSSPEIHVTSASCVVACRAAACLARHRADTELAHHLLEFPGVRRNIGEIQILKRQVAGLCPIVVAGDTVLVNDALVIGCAQCGRGCGGCRALTRGRLRLGVRNRPDTDDPDEGDNERDQGRFSTQDGSSQTRADKRNCRKNAVFSLRSTAFGRCGGR